MKRSFRNRKLTPEEAAKYRKVREQVAAELPELIARHQRSLHGLQSPEAEQHGNNEAQLNESDFG
jgi:hypothetical protein